MKINFYGIDQTLAIRCTLKIISDSKVKELIRGLIALTKYYTELHGEAPSYTEKNGQDY